MLTEQIGGRTNPLNAFLLVPLDGHLSHFQIVPVLERTTETEVTLRLERISILGVYDRYSDRHYYHLGVTHGFRI